MKKIDIKTSVLDYVFILLGSVLYAVAISVFIEPNDVVSGGVVGIALVINKVASFIPVGMGTLIINIPLFIIGFLKFKTDFIVKTTVDTPSLAAARAASIPAWPAPITATSYFPAS